MELLPQFALRPVTEGELKITKTLPIVHYMQKWKEEFLSSILQLSSFRIKECLFGMFEIPFFFFVLSLSFSDSDHNHLCRSSSAVLQCDCKCMIIIVIMRVLQSCTSKQVPLSSVLASPVQGPGLRLENFPSTTHHVTL